MSVGSLSLLVAVVGSVLLAVDSSHGADAPDWRAKWLTDPVFAGAKPFDVMHKQKAKPDLPKHNDELCNTHSYFRRAFTLDEKPQSAHLRITADDAYALEINGTFVGEGPAPGYVFAYPWDEYDVGPLLRKGENVIAVHVYYHGHITRVWCSADHREGLAAELSITMQRLETILLTTDDAWRVKTSEAYKGTRLVGHRTQYMEDTDARLIPHGWTEAGFDDSGWSKPIVRSIADAGYTLVDPGTPPIQVDVVHPKTMRKLGDGHYLLDFGGELTGTTGLRVSGPAGHVIEIRHAEEMESPDAIRFKMRCGVEYRDTWTLAGRENEVVQLFDYKGFRYVELLNVPGELTTEDVWVRRRCYAFDPKRSSFTASSALLEDIWQLCINGVRYGTQGVFVDCPTREKGQYLGDVTVAGISQMFAQGDTRQVRKALLDFGRSSRICPGLMAVAPGNYMQEIADYSLQWPLVMLEYYHHSGDVELVGEMIPVLEGMLAWFAKYENADGLLENVDEKWNLVDWPKNLRDDYDYERAEKGVNTVLNAFYNGALKDAAELLDIVGDRQRAHDHRRHADKHARAFREKLLDGDTRLFVDAEGSTHSSLHANMVPLYFGLVPDFAKDAVLTHLRKKRMACGVYMSFFLLRALFEAGEADLAYDLITSRDERSWHTMLEAGATTCMEAWGPDQKWNTSWCHPWSSAPVSLVAERIMGLRPGRPGWTYLAFMPQTPRALTSASLTLTTPGGAITVSHHVEENGTVKYTLTTPPGMPTIFRLPAFHRAQPVVTCDGQAVTGEISGNWWELMRTLEPGRHEITVRYR